ncbi:MAG: hypothetical protein WCV99_00650 [Sterolibacterium sp.]|jgi:hypothetical protein
MSKPNFRYTTNRQTVHVIPAGMDDRVEVVGDPESGCYEWVIYTPAGVREHSDAAYGSPEMALRDGLISYSTVGSPVEAMRALMKAVERCEDNDYSSESRAALAQAAERASALSVCYPR